MRIRKLILVFAAVIFYICGILFCWSAKDDAQRTYILLSEPIIAVRADEIFIQEAELDDAIGFCFWGEKKKQLLTCKETGGISEVTQVLLSGNPGLLDAAELTWQEGCILDRDSAQKLFGTTDCSQQIVWCQGNGYRVFKAISSTQPIIVTTAKETDGAALDRCVLHVAPEQGKQVAEQFLLRWGLSGQTIDFYPLWLAAYNLLLILPGILLFLVALLGLHQFKRLPFPKKMKPIVLLSVTTFLFILLCCQIKVPSDMFPSRWSDFSYWERWLEGQRENFQLVLRTPMGEHHLQMMTNMVKSILSSTVATMLTVWILRRQKHADPAD